MDTFLQMECVQCIHVVMNSQTGLDYIVENSDFTRKLAVGEWIIQHFYILGIYAMTYTITWLTVLAHKCPSSKFDMCNSQHVASIKIIPLSNACL